MVSIRTRENLKFKYTCETLFQNNNNFSALNKTQRIMKIISDHHFSNSDFNCRCEIERGHEINVIVLNIININSTRDEMRKQISNII